MSLPVPAPALDAADRLERLADGIRAYLDGTLQSERALPGRSFYGEAFSALLLGRDPRYAASVGLLEALYARKDFEDPSFHWEFNTYAWLSRDAGPGADAARPFALPLRFRNTAVANWTLLRSCCRCLAGVDREVALGEALAVLRRWQGAGGLIHDDHQVNSFQYHCFSAVLVEELHRHTGEAELIERFRAAAEFIVPFVLGSGDTLYVGRGQQQTFGYGALACLLATAYRRFEDAGFLAALERVVGFIERHRRADGSFPLVLNDVEDERAGRAGGALPGWYSYNNFFDYLPFLGVFLARASAVLRAARFERFPAAGAARSPPADGFRLFRNRLYEAVVAYGPSDWKGNAGPWSNDLPFPYVLRSGERITPSYGGEQFGSTLYSAAGIPLPAFHLAGSRRLLRQGRLWSWWLGDRLIVASPAGVLVRKFRFLESEIVIDDAHVSPAAATPRFLFDQVSRVDDRTFRVRGGATVTFSEPMVLEDSREHYWGGRLQEISARRPVRRCTARLILE